MITQQDITLRDRVLGGVLGLVVGDALGVPFEFVPRDRLGGDTVSGMAGHGTHNQPAGTWSDDSSLALATLESLLDGYDPADMMRRFAAWLSDAYMTPHGVVFDIGFTTKAAIRRYEKGTPLDRCGGDGVNDNGNGGLMRILPMSLHDHRLDTEAIVDRSGAVSALTHAHVRSRLCCALYSLVVRGVIDGAPLRVALRRAARELEPHAPRDEVAVLKDVLTGDVLDRDASRIRASGYVVHTLEAALWCVWRADNYVDAVLQAVRLGEDTDTTAAVAGGLAGVMHGVDAIPQQWIAALARRDDVEALVNRFADLVTTEEPA